MIIDYKYHIASIVAVFLALGIGILVGSSLIGHNVNDVIVQQQNRMYENLRRDLEKMKVDSRKAQEELNFYKDTLDVGNQFEQSVLPSLISNRLAGKKVAVIETDYSGLHGDWLEVLRKAGAEITSITTIPDKFRMEDKDIRESIATKLMINNFNEKTIVREVAKEVALGIISAQNMENLNYFEQHGLIKLSGSYGVKIDSMIIVGGSDRKDDFRCQNADIPIIKEFLSHNIPVSGVETSNVKYSYMEQYQKLKINTVDNIEMVPGQLSLIMTISGRDGNYGIKPTAKMLIPSIP